MKRKSIIAVLMVAALGVSMTGCGGGSAIVATKADASRTYNIWWSEVDGIGAGGVYDQYEQNAGIVYMTDQERTYQTVVKNSDGSYTKQDATATNKIALHYEAPMAGASPQQSFLTSLNSGSVDMLMLSYSPDTAKSLYDQGVLMDVTWWVENYMPNYRKYLEDNDLYYYATVNVNGERKFLQLYNYEEKLDEWQGYQYRRDWILKYGHPFDTTVKTDGATVPMQDTTYAAAHPDWGWKDYGTANAKWEDGIVFPSYYGYQYNGNGKTTGSLGTLTYSQELDNYIHGEYATYVESRRAQFEEYKGQWPATISDWEWMLDIFQNAVADNNYNEGYGMSLYQGGMIPSGTLVSSFGGGGIEWYRTLDDEDIDGDGKGGDMVFGAEGDGVKEYLSTMRKWYQSGWIDETFASNTDNFWEIDAVNVRKGYVGIYIGMTNQLLGSMDLSGGLQEDATYGICSYGMPFPINDKYGDEGLKYKKPYCFWSLEREAGSIMISTATEKNNKDLPALFTFLDYLYTEEAGQVKSGGLSKEMLENSQQGIKDLYAKYDLQDGAWYKDDAGVLHIAPNYEALDINSKNLLRAVRIGGRAVDVVASTTPEYTFVKQHWAMFENKGFKSSSFYTQLTEQQYKRYKTSLSSIRNSFVTGVPPFIINGSGDFDEAGYDAYINKLKKDCYVDTLTTAIDNLSHRMDGLIAGN